MKKDAVRLKDIIYGGRSYPTSGRVEKWYCTDTKEYVNLQELIDKGVCTNKDKDTLLPALRYIQFFEVDIEKSERHFLNSLNDRRYLKLFDSVPAEDFDIKFNIFLEQAQLEHRWREYENAVLRKAAQDWCIQNRVPFLDS